MKKLWIKARRARPMNICGWITKWLTRSKVAILADEEDLDTLIAALRSFELDRMASPTQCSELLAGLEQLKREAFPE